MSNHQEASEQMRSKIEEAVNMLLGSALIHTMHPKTVANTIHAAILPFLAPPVAAPTDRALACAKHLLMHTMGELRGMSFYANPTDALNGRAAVVAEVIQRICFPAPATATEGELVVSWDSADRDTVVLIARANDKGRTIIYEGRGKDGFWRESHDAARHTATQQKEQKK